ncbi:MAG TPA: DUF1573 domain-containing protein [Gemmataceae bacterium]|nr:DUF1573 domain-containing protein [Gemmataceae bacterium]
MRHGILALIVIGLGSTSVSAQNAWAEKMFKDGLSHDFGSVPRGAQLSHRFVVTNIYAVRMEITSVKSGCGCVTATAAKRVIEPRESTTIDVNMDARRFTGSKTVGITITVGPDYISSAQLRVSANSRADIVFNPGQVSFGTVTRGQAVSQTIDVEYAGVLDWQVTEASAKDLPVEVTMSELYRRPGQVGYRIKVTLKADAAIGTVKGDMYLRTNDPASPLLPVLVEAVVQSNITVAPAAVSLGTVKVGETLTRRVVVRGNKPFRVLKVEGLGEGVSVDPAPSTTAAPVQVVTFKCQFTKAGEFKHVAKIKTDLQDAPVTVTLDGSAAP